MLYLNGRQVADLTIDPFAMARCNVTYAPGRLEAVAWRAGRIVARTAVETAGTPVRLGLVPDRPGLAGDGRDAQPVTVLAFDAQGRAVPTAQTLVHFAATGGRIIGLGNGDPNSHEPDVPAAGVAQRRLYNGLAQVIVQSDRGSAGILTLRAAGPGMIPATADITVSRSALPPRVAPASSVQTLTEWRQSPATPDRPDPTIKLADNDMNSWGWTKPGAAQRPIPSGRYTLLRVAFTPRSLVQRQGGQVVFSSLAGPAEVWLDDRRVAVKADRGIGRLAIVLPPGEGKHTLTVLFDAPLGGPPFGISGSVSVEPGG
jgi:beta-galactosidase